MRRTNQIDQLIDQNPTSHKAKPTLTGSKSVVHCKNPTIIAIIPVDLNLNHPHIFWRSSESNFYQTLLLTLRLHPHIPTTQSQGPLKLGQPTHPRAADADEPLDEPLPFT